MVSPPVESRNGVTPKISHSRDSGERLFQGLDSAAFFNRQSAAETLRSLTTLPHAEGVSSTRRRRSRDSRIFPKPARNAGPLPHRALNSTTDDFGNPVSAERYGVIAGFVSSDDLVNGLAVVDVETLAAGDLQSAGVEAELLENRSMNVGHIVPMLDRVEADFISRSMHDPAFQSAASHPDREAVGVMIAAVGSLRGGSSTKLGGEDHDRGIEQAALFKILE